MWQLEYTGCHTAAIAQTLAYLAKGNKTRTAELITIMSVVRRRTATRRGS